MGTLHSTEGQLAFLEGPGATEDATIRVGCSVTIFDDHGRLLLQKRTDGDWWCLPGGGLDSGDTLTGTAVREAREETGLEVELVRLLGVYTDPEICIVYPDGMRTQIVALNFLARVVGGELIESNDETAELRWCEPNALPANLVPTHRRRIADAIARLAGPHVD